MESRSTATCLGASNGVRRQFSPFRPYDPLKPDPLALPKHPILSVGARFFLLEDELALTIRSTAETNRERMLPGPSSAASTMGFPFFPCHTHDNRRAVNTLIAGYSHSKIGMPRWFSFLFPKTVPFSAILRRFVSGPVGLRARKVRDFGMFCMQFCIYLHLFARVLDVLDHFWHFEPGLNGLTLLKLSYFGTFSVRAVRWGRCICCRLVWGNSWLAWPIVRTFSPGH